MKRSNLSILGACGCTLLIAGCATTSSINAPETNYGPKVTHFSQEKLANGEVKLPAGFNTGDMKNMVMGVLIKASNALPPNAAPGETVLAVDPMLCTRFQTELDKMKRFTMVAIHGVDAQGDLEAAADMSNGAYQLAEQEQTQNIRLFLQGTLTCLKARTVVRGVGNEPDRAQIVYKVQLNVTCKDMLKGTVAFSELAVGKARPRWQTLIGGRASGGFDATTEQMAVWEAAQNALIELCNKLGNTYPSGGHIVGVSRTGDRMQLDKGFNEGIGINQQCCIIIDDGGVKIPLAIAEAAPETTSPTSSLKIWRWNEADPDAKAIMDEFKANPRKFFEANNNCLYGCGYGLPVPPEWEQNATH